LPEGGRLTKRALVPDLSANPIDRNWTEQLTTRIQDAIPKSLSEHLEPRPVRHLERFERLERVEKKAVPSVAGEKILIMPDTNESTPAKKFVRGYCALCTAHCATVATVENGRVTRLDPDDDHPNGGVICIKGKAAPELVYNTDRLNYPLKRTQPKGDPNPGWQRVSWDEALDDIARRLTSIRDRHGAKAVALAKGTKSGTSVDDVERWLGRFLYLFGSPNWVSTTHVCNWHRDTGFSFTFGTNLPTPDLAH